MLQIAQNAPVLLLIEVQSCSPYYALHGRGKEKEEVRWSSGTFPFHNKLATPKAKATSPSGILIIHGEEDVKVLI